jgi:hypothetical protein
MKMSYTEARSIVAQRKLNYHRTNGVLNEYPHDSLVVQDFKRTSDHDFLARVVFVASNIGSDKAVSKILSTFGSSGASSLAEWWSKADLTTMAKLLSNRKRFDPSKADLTRLAKIACPFRDTDLNKDPS